MEIDTKKYSEEYPLSLVDEDPKYRSFEELTIIDVNVLLDALDACRHERDEALKREAVALRAVNALRLTLPLPPSQNHIWKQRRGGRGVYLSEEGREIKQEIGEATFQAVLDKWACLDPHNRPDWTAFPWLRISILYHLPDKRRRDLSNLNKILLDGISEGIQVDDSKFLILEQPPNFDKARPRCEVIITGLTEAQANAQREAFVEVFEG